MQSLATIQSEAAISKRLWVKVLGMLQQNWCILEPGPMGAIDLVFFDDHGKVFDWLTMPDLSSAQIALDANGFTWMWRYSSFYSVGGMPELPEPRNRQRLDPIYSSGEYWDALSPEELSYPLPSISIQTSIPADDLYRFVEAQNFSGIRLLKSLLQGVNRHTGCGLSFLNFAGLGQVIFHGTLAWNLLVRLRSSGMTTYWATDCKAAYRCCLGFQELPLLRRCSVMLTR